MEKKKIPNTKNGRGKVLEEYHSLENPGDFLQSASFEPTPKKKSSAKQNKPKSQKKSQSPRTIASRKEKTKASPQASKSRSLPGQEVFILAGEHSGDLLAGDLMRELNIQRPGLHFFGVGGEQMLKQGLETLEDIENLSVIGFWEALKKYKFLKSLMQRLLAEISSRKCTLAILVDYPGFNLRLAKHLKEMGIPVVFYVSPQIWAWKFKRIFTIKKYVDLILTLFRFEEEIYMKYGVNAKYVGHPLPQRIQESLEKENPLPQDWIKSKVTTIGLLPGSRKQEVHKLLDILLQSAQKIHRYFRDQYPNRKIHYLLPNINPNLESYIQRKVERFRKKNPEIQIHNVFRASSRVMEASDLLLLASGTATLEGVYWEKPMVILYRVSFFTYFLSSFLVRTPYIGLVNILAGKEICRELIQSECNPRTISQEAIHILTDTVYRRKMIREITNVKNRELSIQNAAKEAAAQILIGFLSE